MEDEDFEDLDDGIDFDPQDVEHLCIKCGAREAIINRVCHMCSELYPNMV